MIAVLIVTALLAIAVIAGSTFAVARRAVGDDLHHRRVTEEMARARVRLRSVHHDALRQMHETARTFAASEDEQR